MRQLLVIEVELDAGVPDLQLPAGDVTFEQNGSTFVVSWEDGTIMLMDQLGALGGNTQFMTVAEVRSTPPGLESHWGKYPLIPDRESPVDRLQHLGANVRDMRDRYPMLTPADKAWFHDRGCYEVSINATPVSIMPRSVFAGLHPHSVALIGFALEDGDVVTDNR